MINIAIDGTVGSGKSTLARGIADRLGFHVLDTGAIYRALACSFRDEKHSKIDEQEVEEFIKDKKIEVFFVGKNQHVSVNGVDYTDMLREEEISNLASQISPYPVLREKVRELQQEFAKRYDCIIEGRDIATDVLPNADFKFFLTAKPEIRAMRRYQQSQEKNISYEEVLKDLKERDYRDEHRKVAPLKPAKDSIIVDNSQMTLEQTIEYCLNIINKKYDKYGKNKRIKQ